MFKDEGPYLFSREPCWDTNGFGLKNFSHTLYFNSGMGRAANLKCIR